MDGVTHTDEDGPDGRRSAELVEQLIRDVSSAQVRKYQYVGWFLQGAERVTLGQHAFVEGAIGLHFSVDHDIRVSLSHELDRPRHFLRVRVADRAEVREAEH